MPAFIVDSLLPLAIDIGSVVPDARNARLHSARSITAIQESLRQFGQRKPIIVQRQGMVVRAGNGTLEAARRLGWDRIAAVLLDDSDATAQAYAIADNRTAELAEWDFETLAGTLKALKDTDIDINALGWADFELEPLLQAE